MKKHSGQVLFCGLGLVIGLGMYSVFRNDGEDTSEPLAPSYRVHLAKTPKIETLDWRQPLIHPSFPPKLVWGEKEFVLK